MPRSGRSRRLGRFRPRQVAIGVGIALVLAVLVFWLTLPSVAALARTNPTTTAMIDLRRRQAQDAHRPFVLRWTWRPLARISPLLARAVIFSEDAEFWKHEGIDWEALKEAAEHDWHKHSLERGASTITEQVAKNLFLSPSRSLLRKLREMFIARRLERALGKERILEVYLNIAEWGDGIFGAEAAARRYYGRPAADLDAAQAARLAVALPNPFRRSPEARSRALDRHAARLVRALRRSGIIDEEAAARASRELGVAEPARPAGPGAPGAPVAAPPPPEPELEPLPAAEPAEDPMAEPPPPP